MLFIQRAILALERYILFGWCSLKLQNKSVGEKQVD